MHPRQYHRTIQLRPQITLMSKKQIKKGEEEDISTLKLAHGYRKRCDLYGLPVYPVIKLQLDTVQENNQHLQLLHCTAELGPMQMRAFFEVASELAYIHLRRIRIWKCSIGDEGVRYLCKYLCSSYSLNLIDLLDNGITALGCEFIGKAVQSPACRVLHLKLDNNLILSEGLKFLAVGLRQNHVLDKLSLKYCGINGQGAMYVQQILANIGSRLRSLKLQGNQLGNEGVYQVLRAVDCCESLSKLNIADTGMNLLDYTADGDTIVELLAHQLLNMVCKNKLMIKYDIRFNQLHDQVAVEILKAVEGNQSIKSMAFPTNVNYNLREALDTLMRKRNKGQGRSRANVAGKSKAKTKR